MTTALVDSLIANTDLDAATHRAESIQALRDHKKQHEESLRAQLDDILTSANNPVMARQIERSKKTGSWLTAMPSVDYGTFLSHQEFQDSLRLRFGLLPKGLPKLCDGCPRAVFDPVHAQQCPKGGLVGGRHEDLCFKWGKLCSLALTPTSISDEPIIPKIHEQEGNNSESTELRGDVAAYSFWSRGVTAVFDVRVTDTDCKSYIDKDPKTVLARQEKEKKKKYTKACEEAHLHFTPLVFSVDGLEGSECTAALKQLSSKLAAKWNRQYSQIVGFVQSRLAFTLVRAASRCLRGTRTPRQRVGKLAWASGSSVKLYNRLL